MDLPLVQGHARGPGVSVARKRKHQGPQELPPSEAYAPLLAAIDAALARVQAAEQDLDEREADLRLALAREAKVSPARLVVGHWYCPANGSRRCAYNERFDPCHDHCLFCGHPSDRA